MRYLLFVGVILSFCHAHAEKLEIGGQMWISYRQGIEGAGLTETHGFNASRLRLKLKYQFSEKWRYSGKIQSQPPKDMQITESVFLGRDIFLKDDQVAFGAQDLPHLRFFYPALKTRWISKGIFHSDSGGKIPLRSTGLGYDINMGDFWINIFAGSDESTNVNDQGNRSGHHSLAVTYKASTTIDIFLSHTLQTHEAAAHDTTADPDMRKNFTTSSIMIRLLTQSLSGVLEYNIVDDTPSTKATESGVTDEDAQKRYGLTTSYKYSDKSFFFLRYVGGFEKTDNYEYKLRFGPGTFLEKKLKVGLFFDFNKSNKDLLAKDEKAVYAIMAANF